MPVPTNSQTPVNITGTGLVVQGAGRVVGIFVTTSSSLTLKLWDNDNAGQASGNVLLPTTAVITAPAFFAFRANFSTGVYATFGGTGTVTIVYERV